MKVKDHKKFCCFEYTSATSNKISLGDVVIKEGTPNEIGVIIQIHDENSYRTDMFGNCSIDEIRVASYSEIKAYRSDLLNDLIPTLTMGLMNLRVAVVPTETGANIDQSSSVEEILACDQTELYAVTDYFQAQNNEELPMHWSFLIDIVENVELTGCNIEGIHC